jgi:hypothetical protein
MRFVVDANNFVGMLGLGFAAGLGWTAGAWLAGRILSVLKF